jgi:hypothetical protein
MDDSVHFHQNILEIEDLGQICEVVNEFVDYGLIDDAYCPTTCYVANVGVTKDKNGRTGLKIKGVSITLRIIAFNPYKDLNSMDIIYYGIIIRWIGCGTVFELDNGTERIVSPYLSTGTTRKPYFNLNNTSSDISETIKESFLDIDSLIDSDFLLENNSSLSLGVGR